MNDIAIKVENLGKLYRIGAQQELYPTLRESLVSNFKRLTTKRTSQSANNTIWALKDVSFEIKRGEVVGIIGRNGAGKSTLLKVLAHITEPTEGRVILRGRVGSLLEVGTGFHPELTGRENIYLNGAILGMKKVEIERKFDEIVAFTEIEKFLDTPVKHYSSGMYIRLAFAVAAHMDPEILLVDEVLAVGDAAFQKKCLGKMGQVAGEGRTVLFVSHNMVAVRSLCKDVYLIESGKIVVAGRADEVINKYIVSTNTQEKDDYVIRSDMRNREGNGKVIFREWWIEDKVFKKSRKARS
jgi:lipopolysaccharide transport system ATP-binding protein